MPKQLARARMLRAKYNLTLAQYAAILAHQGGGCAICGRPPGKVSLAVDHCHKTLAVRGLLCSFCNRGLRYYRDRADLMARGAQYLWCFPVLAALGHDVFAPAKQRKRRKRPRRSRLKLAA